MDSLLEMAVRNNAAWCDAVCSAVGANTRFSDDLWVCEGVPPPYYPHVVTLERSSPGLMDELRSAIEAARAVGGRIGVKDSYGDLDLGPLGFRVLFEAEWIGREASLPIEVDASGLRWDVVRDADELEAWKRGWDAEILETHPVFAPKLVLSRDDIWFIAGHRDGAIVAGASVNRHAGVLGMSNVFLPAPRDDSVLAGLVGRVMACAPGLPLVGYEGGAELEAMVGLELRSLGGLSVWVSGD